MGYFYELFGGLPRGGPGDDASTRRAWRMMTGVPAAPEMLDVGCGPGRPTLELARLSKGRITALDNHQPFLDLLDREAARSGLSERIRAVNKSMFEMDFPPESFDVIWSEGALFIIGIEKGLGDCRPLLKNGGHLAMTEAVRLKPDLPEPVRELWEEYPALTTIEANLEIIRKAGYRSIGHFLLPDRAWTDEFYDPMEKRIAELRKTHAGNDGALAVFAKCQNEIDIFRAYSGFYGYAFFVMKK